MQVEFRRSFVKDIERTRNERVRERVAQVIRRVEAAASLTEVANLRRLTADGPYYRIRVGPYRIGVLVADDTVVFVRLLHRRDIYRYFP